VTSPGSETGPNHENCKKHEGRPQVIGRHDHTIVFENPDGPIVSLNAARFVDVPECPVAASLQTQENRIQPDGDPLLNYPDAKQEVCPNCQKIMSPK